MIAVVQEQKNVFYPGQKILEYIYQQQCSQKTFSHNLKTNNWKSRWLPLKLLHSKKKPQKHTILNILSLLNYTPTWWQRACFIMDTLEKGKDFHGTGQIMVKLFIRYLTFIAGSCYSEHCFLAPYKYPS